MIHECSLANSTLDARRSLPVSHTYRGNAISTLVKHSQKKRQHRGDVPASKRTVAAFRPWRIGKSSSHHHDAVLSGEGGIRTHDTLSGYTRFPIVRLRPLGHLSRIAEEEKGFEPLIRQAVYVISSHAPSTTRPFLHRLLRPQFFKEFVKDIAALISEHTFIDFNPVIESWIFAEGKERTHRTGFWVTAPKNDSIDPRL